MPKVLKLLIGNVILAVCYFALAYVGLKINTVSGFATFVWPPTGIAIASLLLYGMRYFPGITIAAFAVNLVTGASPVAAAGIALGNTLEAVFACWALRKAGFKDLDTLRHTVTFIILAAALAPLISAAFGISSLYFSHTIAGDNLPRTALAWWLGDALGALLVAPFIMVWLRGGHKSFNQRQAVEALILLGTVIGVNLLVFTQYSFIRLQRGYLIFMPLLWSAARFKSRMTTLALVVTSAISIYGTVKGYGPFSDGTLSFRLYSLQAFMGAASIAALVLSAISAEKGELIDKLDTLVDEKTRSLEEAQAVAHLGSWEWDVPADKVTWSKGLFEIFGVSPDNFAGKYSDFIELVHPEDRTAVDGLIRLSLQKKEPFSFDSRIVRPDGGVRTIHSRGQVTVDAAGKVVRMSGVAQDVTEERAAVGELRKRTAELEKLNAHMVDRELKMIELKEKLGAGEKAQDKNN